MARTTIAKDNQAQLLKSSLKQLNAITKIAYEENIRHVALKLWKKDLTLDNPQWKHIQFKSFYVSTASDSAHVIAMLDQRLPEIGLVGYFACTNTDIGSRAIEQACDWLRSTHAVGEVYGPINGTLPNDYRISLHTDYVFPGEPVNPAWHLDAFKNAGFSVYNKYSSGRLKHFNLWLKFSMKKSIDGNFTVRPFNNDLYDNDFEIYHELRNKIFPFQSNYCPVISLEERRFNAPGKFDPHYTYFVMDNEKEVGFIMAYIYEKQLILKTIGLLEEYRGRNLSRLLLKPIHEQAKKDKISTAIYAMVRVGNKVYKNKHPLAKEFRHYVTMRRKF